MFVLCSTYAGLPISRSISSSRFSFRVARVGEKCPHVGRRRRQAGQIEIDAADELGVGAQLARQRLDPLQLVDTPACRCSCSPAVLPGEAAAIAHDGDGRRGVGPFEAGEHGRLAAAQGRDQAVLVGLENLGVAAFDERLGAHVAHAAVGVGGQHAELLLHLRQRDDRRGRLNLDLRDARGGAIELRPLRDPALEQFVVRLARLDQHAADVRHRAARLEQHQALLGHRPIEAPGGEVVGQRTMIEQRIVAAERELEAVLALGRAVAGAGVAAELRHGRHHVVHEAHLVIVTDAADADGNDDRLLAERKLDLRFAVGLRTNQAGRRNVDQLGRLFQAWPAASRRPARPRPSWRSAAPGSNRSDASTRSRPASLRAT